MSLTVPRSRIISAACMFFLWNSFAALVVCSAADGADGSVDISRAGSKYRVAVNGEECVRFSLPEVKGCGLPDVRITPVDDLWHHIRLLWDVARDTAQDEVSVRFDLSMTPDFWWAPHLAPEDGNVIGQHAFRAPCMTAQRGSLTLVVAPDLDVVAKRLSNPWFMDLDAPRKAMWIGMMKTEVQSGRNVDRLFFRRASGMTLSPGKLELSFFIAAYHDRGKVRNPWAEVTRFQWKRWGHPLYVRGNPVHAPLETYMRHTYDWAFKRWKKHVWQEFDLNGVRVGAPQFIVNISQSPNYSGEWYQREFLSIWNQAWFSSLRSASGLFRYARRTGDAELLRKARLTKELALAAPMKNGIFPAVIRTPRIDVTIKGRTYRRPLDWTHAFWENSNRCPFNYGITREWYHILDASWTCLLMLRWYEELEKDARLVSYARTYADRLLALQDPQGFFPGWLHPETQKPGPVMNQTPETSMSVTFLLKLAGITGAEKYRDAALRAMDAQLVRIIPDGCWEDFETYWSSSPYGRDNLLGKKVARNAMHKQNNFSTFWAAEALLASYRATKDRRYLKWGLRTLDELSMCQQVWRPPYIYVPALGGFGVMNADGEWNDSRQNLFAELFLDYYRETGDASYFERGVAALESGFIMMYCPENPVVRKMWEKVYPWFGPEDYGFTMENYAHGARTSPEGQGMGVFTIYDWGNGAASEAAARIVDHYGQVYIDRRRGRVFGVDEVHVRRLETGWLLINPTGKPRTLQVVFDDGTKRELKITGKAVVPPEWCPVQ